MTRDFGRLAQRFGRFAERVMQSMKANDDESETLAALRDILLPKLISGELRVKDGERIVTAAF